MTEEKDFKDLPEGEQNRILWSLLQAFLWSYVALAAILALAAGPLFGRPGLIWGSVALAAPALLVILWVQVKKKGKWRRK